MIALAYSQFCYQDALAQSGADLASQCNAESRIGCRPLLAGPVVPRRVVVVLAKDDAITCARRLAAEHDRLPQSGHRLVQRVLKHIAWILFSTSLLTATSLSLAQDETEQHWNGEWIADGTLFQIEVAVENNVMKVSQIESLGFVWTSQDGKVNGNTVQVEVEYAGVKGIIQVELVDPNTAIAFAASCLPEFMVVCSLAKDRQAVFKKVQPN